jgi:zinc/manganese transport system substrate-binding protein
MKKILVLLLAALAPLLAKVNVAASYPFIAELSKTVGGDHVEVITLAKGNWDPHFVVPRPSLIRKVARADLLIINGAQLEIGWMPPLIRQANNRNIQPGKTGFLDLSQFVTLINKPVSVSRANGDVHPAGNPHYATDPFVMPALADAIAARLGVIDPGHADAYLANAEAFKAAWQKHLDTWQQEMAPMEGTKVVQYHELYNYFLKRFGLVTIGNIEPLPGINPSSRHTMELIKRMRSEHVGLILQDVYHSQKTADFIAEKTGARVVLMPHDVHAVHEADSLEALYDTMIQRLKEK